MAYQKVLVKKSRWKPVEERYQSFEKAREFTRDLCSKKSVMTLKDWINAYEKNLIPKSIPKFPQAVYKRNNCGWISWNDFVGVSHKNYYLRKFLPFNKAKAYMKKQKLTGHNDWALFRKKRPSFIPSNPHTVYEEYKNLEDWLGLEPRYRSFEDAKKLLKRIKIKTRRKYWSYLKNNSSCRLPFSADHVYKDNWKSWGDYLGSGYIATTKRSDGYYVSFDECKKFIHKFKFKSQREWEKWNRENVRPHDIPMGLSKVYKNEWNGWADMLGYEPKIRYTKVKFNYKKASQWAQEQKLKSSTEFKNKIKTDKNWLPIEIAQDVEDYFRKREQWKGWSKFLGLPKSRNVKRDFRTYDQTKAWAKRKKITNYNEWTNAKKPFNIPENPYKCYKNRGWVNWKDFLGINYFEFDKAKEVCKKFVIENNIKTWTEFHKNEGKIHKNLPGSVYGYYSKNPNWISCSDFIGTTQFSKTINYLKYEEAKRLVHELKLKNQNEFLQARRNGLLPITVPSTPHRVYGNKR